MEVIKMSQKGKITVRQLTITAIFMAINVALSSSIFSIPVPGGHLYVNDIVICTAALMFDPFSAFAVGGLGAFIGDLLFYPAPMFVSLVTHGLQAVVISLSVRYLGKKNETVGTVIGLVLGVVINVVGYSLGRAFIYSTPEQAALKLPFQILQASVGAAIAPVLCYAFKLKKVYTRYLAL